MMIPKKPLLFLKSLLCLYVSAVFREIVEESAHVVMGRRRVSSEFTGKQINKPSGVPSGYVNMTGYESVTVLGIVLLLHPFPYFSPL